jgi:hypothetical protein
MAKLSPLRAKPDRHLEAIHRLSDYLERSRMADYVDLLHRPFRLVWVNFTAGVARGVGIVVGASLVVTLVILVLKAILHHVGGVPWIGAQLSEGISWVLDVIDKHQGQ